MQDPPQGGQRRALVVVVSLLAAVLFLAHGGGRSYLSLVGRPALLLGEEVPLTSGHLVGSAVTDHHTTRGRRAAQRRLSRPPAVPS